MSAMPVAQVTRAGLRPAHKQAYYNQVMAQQRSDPGSGHRS